MQSLWASRASFDRIARAYRWLEYCCFGRGLERCRGLRTAAIRQTGHALLLGDGDGRFTAHLLARQAGVRVVAVDSSEAMLALLEERVRQVGASSRLVVVQGEAVSLFDSANGIEASQTKAIAQGPEAVASQLACNACQACTSASEALCPAEGFAYVCTHFFLDCLSTADVERLIDGVMPRLASEALWIVSEFTASSWWTRLVVAVLYRCFAVLTGLRVQQLPEWQAALSGRGFVCIGEQRLLGGLLISTLWRRVR